MIRDKEFHQVVKDALVELKREIDANPPSNDAWYERVVSRVEDLEGILNDEFESIHRKIEELGGILNEALENTWLKQRTDTAENDDQSLIQVSLSS